MTALWMLAASFCFGTMAVFVKLGAAHFDPVELAFYRSLGGLLLISGFVLSRGETVASPHMRLHLFRSVAGIAGAAAYFYCLAELPLASATTLNYTSPLFLAAITTLFLRERFSTRLLVAVAAGFGGVVLLLEPTFGQGKAFAGALGLASGLVGAWAYLGVRALGRVGEPEWRVLFWFSAVGTVGCAAWQLAFSGFHALRWETAWILVGMVALGTLGQLTLTRAYGRGNTLVAGTVSYSTIIFSAAYMAVLWDDHLKPSAWAGIAIIVAAGILATAAGRPRSPART